jgi:hypothetical protein
LAARGQSKLRRLVSAPRRRRVSRLCATVAFLNSFMLHFGGSDLADMELVDLNVSGVSARQLYGPTGGNKPGHNILYTGAEIIDCTRHTSFDEQQGRVEAK